MFIIAEDFCMRSGFFRDGECRFEGQLPYSTVSELDSFSWAQGNRMNLLYAAGLKVLQLSAKKNIQ